MEEEEEEKEGKIFLIRVDHKFTSCNRRTWSLQGKNLSFLSQEKGYFGPAFSST